MSPLRNSLRLSASYPEKPTSRELPVDFPPGTRWGICLSHDVDHLGLRDHLIDGFLPRYIFNLFRQHIFFRFNPVRAIDCLFGVGMAVFGRDRWDTIGKLLETERKAGVSSTWFVSARPGLGISYNLEQAQPSLRLLTEAEQEVGLHGQSATNAIELASEANDLAHKLGSPITGLRMHYLRLTGEVFDGMEQAGLLYDSTVMDRSGVDPEQHPLSAPRLVRRNMYEIPLHIMDSTLFSATGFGLDLVEARDYTSRLMKNACEHGRLVVVNLHPNSYSRQTPEIRDWYDFFLHEITRRSDVFLTDFRGLLPRLCKD